MLKCSAGLGPLFAVQACWYEQAVGSRNVWGTVLLTLPIFLHWTFWAPMTQKINLSFQYDTENNLKMVFGNLYQVIDWVVLIVKKQCIWKSQGQSSQRSLHLMSCWRICHMSKASSDCSSTMDLMSRKFSLSNYCLLGTCYFLICMEICLFIYFWFLLLQSRVANLWSLQASKSCAVPPHHSHTIHGKSGQETSVKFRPWDFSPGFAAKLVFHL